MRKSMMLLAAGFLCAGAVLADSERVTLPAAASIVGGAPFFSDVRAFNTSYTDTLQVTATYRCFIGPCPGSAPTTTFSLAPRQSQAFDDMVASTFTAPNTAGGVEFDFTGSSGELVVTSRLFSTSPTPTVGMFIPALDNSDAHPTTVLTSIRNGGPNQGFRTNVGMFNPEDSAVNVTFSIFDETGAAVGTPVSRSVPGHSGVQVSGIFNAAGAPGTTTDNAVIVVSAATEIFSYAAVIDNNTTDPIFVVGSQDNPLQAFTPVITAVASTPTPTPPAATPTPTPTAPAGGGSQTVNIGQGGDRFVDSVSGSSTTTITHGMTVHWVWFGFHSTTSDPNQAESWDQGPQSSGSFDKVFNNPGTFTYFCTVHGHMMSGTIIVN